MEVKMEEIMTSLIQMNSKLEVLDELKAEMSALRTILEGFTMLKEQVEELREESSVQKKRIDELEDRLDYLENQSRRENLVIRGIPEKDGETWEDCAGHVIEVAKKVGVTMMRRDAVRAHRVRHGAQPRPIVVKMSSWSKREEILKNKHKLKGSHIFVMEDFSKKVIEERRVLFEEANRKWRISKS